MLVQHRPIGFRLGLAILVVLILGLAGCGDRGPAPTPTPMLEAGAGAATPVVTILRNPNITEVPVGGQVAISAEASGRNLQFKWRVEKGTLSSTEGPSVIYTAPDVPGIDTVDVIVISDGGTTTKTATFTVVVPPTETPTSTPMPVTATPTSEKATSTPTETPVCVSHRPPIEGINLPGKLQITTPTNCATGLPMAQRLTVAGTYSDMPDDVEIWILVYPEDQKYYPQSPNACEELPATKGAGRWSTIAFLGRPDHPEQFDIVSVLVRTDSEASKAFKEYLRTGCDTGPFEGFVVLPQGVDEKDFITVRTGQSN